VLYLSFHGEIESKSTKGDVVPLLLFHGEVESKSTKVDVMLLLLLFHGEVESESTMGDIVPSLFNMFIHFHWLMVYLTVSCCHSYCSHNILHPYFACPLPILHV